jgi:sarcosine oxidase subunit beta
MQSYDIIVVGGGFLGLSTAYHLAGMGASVCLLEAGDLGSGTSATCSGRAQVSEGHLDDLNILLIREGLARFDGLQEELGMGFEWQRMPYLCLIRSEHLWDSWAERAAVLTPAGIPVELIGAEQLQREAPHLNMDGMLGAAVSLEGLLNPFRFCWAYAQAAHRNGVDLRPRTPVTAMQVTERGITAVQAGSEWLSAGAVAVMCGAWTPQVTAMAGADVPVHCTHAEAYITEPMPGLFHHTYGLADFYETIHGKERAVAIGFSPEPNGTLIITEAVTRSPDIHRGASFYGVTKISRELQRLFPVLAGARVVRSWGAPTAFTPDEEPVIGWLPTRNNLFVAASLVETITTVPLLGEWMATMLLGGEPPHSLAQFDPARFVEVTRK